MANSVLTKARAAKNDEFYTQLPDVEREMFAYLDYDRDVFRNKTVLLPCDDPSWSAFTQFFALKFDELGLRKLISTSYNAGGRGKRMTLTSLDLVAGAYPLDCLQITELQGDGDFRSAEVTALRDEADFVITNPPFSLFREFLAWIRAGGQRFSLIGNKNAITYKEVFPLIQAGEMWCGARSLSDDMLFAPPAGYTSQGQSATSFRVVNGKTFLRASAVWFTNIDHGKRHERLDYLTMTKNLTYNTRLTGKPAYVRYDNYDAIEVPISNAIPSDYDGVMGVPISYLDKHCPEAFEIVGITEANGTGLSGTVWAADSGCKHALINGQKVYARVFIRAIR
jgi:hypothetical protein